MYWVEWIENGEKKSIVAEGWIEWAAYLKTCIKSGLSMLNGKGFNQDK